MQKVPREIQKEPAKLLVKMGKPMIGDGHKGPRPGSNVHRPQRGAEVYYRDCGLPDHVSKATAILWLRHGQLRAGDRIRMDGKEFVIQAGQSNLEL